MLDGKTVLITGAGGRIGRATCSLLAERGAHVIASDVDSAALDETLRTVGRGMAVIQADLSDGTAVARLVQDAHARHGRLDVLVNNGANLDPGGQLVDCTDDQFHHTLAVNLVAPFVAIREVIPLMLVQGGGAIVNVASVLGLVGRAGFSAYAISKAALVQLTRQVALEHSAAGIRCNAVAPGTVATEHQQAAAPELWEVYADEHPVGRVGVPNEIAEVIAFLSDDASSFVHGAVWPIDGGWSAR